MEMTEVVTVGREMIRYGAFYSPSSLTQLPYRLSACRLTHRPLVPTSPGVTRTDQPSCLSLPLGPHNYAALRVLG